MPPLTPGALAEKLLRMARRRRPDLLELIDELSRTKAGQALISKAFDSAYEAYVRSRSVDAAFDALVSYLEGAEEEY